MIRTAIEATIAALLLTLAFALVDRLDRIAMDALVRLSH